MFGINYVKFAPNVYVLKYKNGKTVREGAGLSFFYFKPDTSLVAVPLNSSESLFIFSEVTSDFQEISIQGQATYKITDPKKISSLMNYALDDNGKNYVSDDPEKLESRVVNAVKVIVKNELKSFTLKDSLLLSEHLVNKIRDGFKSSSDMAQLGIELLGVSILAIKPKPETAKALEAETREQILKKADEAIYNRRNASVEQERSIKENELNTEIAIENKNKQIMETKMSSVKSEQMKKQELEEESLKFEIAQEEKNRQYVELRVKNSKLEADAKAYGISASLKALENVDPSIINAIAASGMEPNKLIALAFRGIADKAEKIGQLNITPDLLEQLTKTKGK
ncbi:MAG: SPFH domain-containing protein [Spirochaetia bacterium]|nr:SPFH domain-containing protein [Spirochaetia bacterium]